MQGTDFTVAAMAGGDLGLGSSESSNPFLDRDAISLSLSDGAMLDLSLAGEPSGRAGGPLVRLVEVAQLLMHRWSACSPDAFFCGQGTSACAESGDLDAWRSDPLACKCRASHFMAHTAACCLAHMLSCQLPAGAAADRQALPASQAAA